MYALQEKEKSWTIHSNWKVEIPWHRSCNFDSKTRKLGFDPTKTQIIGAELYIKAFSDNTGCIGEYLINDEAAARLEWRGPFDIGVWKEARVDVTTLLRQGANTFKAQACKTAGQIWTYRVYYTSILTVTYTGEDPDVGPPEPPPVAWEKYLPYIVLGASAAAVLVIWTRSK